MAHQPVAGAGGLPGPGSDLLRLVRPRRSRAGRGATRPGGTTPPKHSTIQLADVNGDGKDELLGRGDAGLEIWTFDTSVGQWRPQVDANAVPQILTDVRSPLPSEDFLGWQQPEYYSTIQTANVDGKPGVEVIARFPDGMHAYGYTPPAGGNSIDGGTWSTLATRLGPVHRRQRLDGPPALPDDQVRRCRGPLLSHLVSTDSNGMEEFRVGRVLELDAGLRCFLPDGAVQRSGVLYVAAGPAGGRCSGAGCWPIPGTGWARASWPSRVPGVASPSPPSTTHRPAGFLNGPLSNKRGSPDCPLSGTDLCFPQIAALDESTRLANLCGISRRVFRSWLPWGRQGCSPT